nr:hypothetical protein [Tanacetum cinerariifolium]
AVLEACLVNECITLNDNTGVTKSSRTESENSSSQQPHPTFPQLDSGLAVQHFYQLMIQFLVYTKQWHSCQLVTPQQVQGRQSQNVAGIRSKKKILLDAKKMLVDTTAFDNENDDIGTSYDSDMVSEVYPDMFEIVFAHGIKNHKEPKSSPDTYVVNENNSDITSDILNMDPDRGNEEHDKVNYEKQCAFFAFLINNLKCDVENCNEVNREARQANALLTNQLERYKEKEKHFAKDMAIESAYCKKIKILNDEISYLKSQACQKDNKFSRENEKFDEGKQGLGSENQNDDVHLSLLHKDKELTPCLYNIDEMGKDALKY